MGRTKTIDDDDVLAAAREVFRREGHSASTRDVARAAGISQAVLYQRFGSKEELFFRAMTPEAPDIEALLGPYRTKDPEAELVALGERILGFMRAFTPTLLQVLALPGVETEHLKNWHSRLPFLPIVDAVAERFRRLTADGVMAAADPRASAVAFMAAMHSLALFELMTSARERKHRGANVQTLVAVLWHGLKPR